MTDEWKSIICDSDQCMSEMFVPENMRSADNSLNDEALKKYKTPVMWLDSDIIVRKPLHVFWDQVKPTTFMVTKRITTDISSKFNSGCFCLGYSNYSVDFMSDYYHSLYVKGCWKHKWPPDQRYLFKCYQRYQKDIELINLSSELHDFSFSPNSVLWHSKSSRFDDPKFQKEFTYYFFLFSLFLQL